MSENDSTWATGASDDRVARQSPPQEQEPRQESTPAGPTEPIGASEPTVSAEQTVPVEVRPSETPTTSFPAGPYQGGGAYPGAPTSPYQGGDAQPGAPTGPHPGYPGPSFATPTAQFQTPGVTYPGQGSPYWQPAPSAPTSGHRAARGVVIGAAAVALALFSGLTGGFVVHEVDGGRTVTVTRNAAPVLERTSVAGVAAAVQPSVVDIATGVGEGSGVIISADGAILTNNHVIEGARGNTVDVTFSNGKSAKATIVGTDPVGDLAVVKAQGVSGLAAAKFGDSDAVQVGDSVLALGSPLGLQGSVTAGIVSALHRTIDEGAEQQQQDPFGGGSSAPQRSIGDAIQTDAAINPGNSGGALVNLAGEVIGINTAIATSGQGSGNIGVGFAISSNKAKATADQLLKGGKVSHPFLGVSVNNGDGGALIVDVVPGSPADKAGLRKGDLVTKIGSRTVTDSKGLVGAVQSGKAGDQLQVTVVRNGAEQQVTVTLGEQNG